MMHRPVQALQQSYLRTKTTDLESFLLIARLQANSSNNTLNGGNGHDTQIGGAGVDTLQGQAGNDTM